MNKNFILVALLSFILLNTSCAGKDKEKNSEKGKIVYQKTTTVTETKPKTSTTLGQRMFIACASCHSLKKGEAHKTGPNLYGLFGKKAATADGYEYSEAIKSSNIVWSDETLRKWLEDPDGYIPGTKMAFIGIQRENQQTALIEYLKEETKE